MHLGPTTQPYIMMAALAALAAAFVATLPGTVATAQNTAAARSDELAPENLDLYNASPLMRAIADVDSEQVRDFLI